MFGSPKCGYCDKSGTKLTPIEPAGSRIRYTAICCNSILGVTEQSDSGTILKKIETENATLLDKIQRVEHSIEQIALGLNRL